MFLFDTKEDSIIDFSYLNDTLNMPLLDINDQLISIFVGLSEMELFCCWKYHLRNISIYKKDVYILLKLSIELWINIYNYKRAISSDVNI